ncbi:MAG: tyrosine-type recombinase/integrase [Candidatus Binataceae bacterium]
MSKRNRDGKNKKWQGHRRNRVPEGLDKWWALVKHQGKQHWRRAANKTHARDLYHEIKTLIRKGEWPPKREARPALFDELMSDYRAASARAGKAIMRTDAGYRRALEAFGGRRAPEIAVREVEAWRDRLAEFLAPASVAHHLTMLRAIFNRAVRDGKLAAAPTRGVEFPRENNARVRYLSEDEEPRLLAALAEKMRPLVMVAIYTGLREGELLRLRWADVDFGSGSIHVREAKSGDGRRLPLNQAALGTLHRLRGARPKVIQLDVRRDAGEGGHIFGPDTNALRMSLNRKFRRAAKAAGIDDLHFHDLRHTFASRLAMRGLDLYRVQTLLGHKTARMTMRYAHLSPGALREAVEALDVAGPKPWAAERQGS